MRERACKNCGGKSYKIVGQNMVRCRFCATLYVDEYSSKEEEVLLVGAYEKLREGRFSDAIEQFDNILSLYPLSFEGYYGKMLAKNKIVLYNSKKGFSKFPRFFGEEIPSVLEDEDFKKAIELAPPEAAKTYSDQAKKIEKTRKLYLENYINQNYDVLIYSLNFDSENKTGVIFNIDEELRSKQLTTYFFQNSLQKEKEEESFRALQTSKVFVLFANDKKGYADSEFKNLCDRYLYFTHLKKKTKSSFIVVLDTEKISINDLPKWMASGRSIVEMDSPSFMQDIQQKIKNEIEKSTIELAKIETVKIEQVNPQKKEYVNFESINPSELGHYHVDNVPLNESNKIKWIFLTLKHGDFSSANELISAELEKDQNNAELLFAQILCLRKIKTQEEFFSNVANFRDKDLIDKILKFASKEFAEYFVDRWESLIMSLDSEEYYNAFLLYLAKFNSPNRDKFVTSAENKAVETLNNELIDKVLKCFKNDEVERFVNFYFMLAQKSDNQEYYQKVLSIDEGHEQSNLAILLQNFKTDEDKLTYRNRSEVEEVFKYLDENTRAQFVSAVVNMILPLSFLDIEKCEVQLDFYLSYVSSTEKLVSILNTIAVYFQGVGFFKQAEKYISIAITKDKEKAELYWTLIKIKAHCKSDKDLIKTDIKITQMPEWETLISLSEEKETEKYAEIASKINLYKGEKSSFKPDALDRVHIIEKLRDFVLRNNKILLEMEAQEETQFERGISYFKLQLQPFEVYAEKIKEINDIEQFQDITEKTYLRLEALDLTLDSSINVTHLMEKNLANVEKSDVKATEKKKEKKNIRDIGKDKFLKRFLYIFLELFPILFTTLLLVMAVFIPKELYMNFSQDFLVILTIFSTTVGMVHLVAFINTKQKVSKSWSVANMTLFCVAAVNLVLLCFGFYLIPKTITIENSHELQVLLKNASYSKFELNSDIDMSGKMWESVKFSGTFDGKGHSISNLKFKSGKSMGLFKRNSGEIKNLEVYLADVVYDHVGSFGSIAVTNQGLIENCTVFGNLTFELDADSVIGGIAGTVEGGSIENCESYLTISISIENSNLTLGGIAGEVKEGKEIARLNKNTGSSVLNIISNGSSANIGGLIGMLSHMEGNRVDISENISGINLMVSGQVSKIVAGGLVGQGNSSSKNNVANGEINISSLTGNGYIGGLYGQYENSTLADAIETSYSTVRLINNATVKTGGLVGGLGGKVRACFSSQAIELVGEKKFTGAQADNCYQLTSVFYDSRLGFDGNIWLVNGGSYPILKHTL